MGLFFTEEQEKLRERTRKFAEEVLAPNAEKIDREGFDYDTYKKFMAAGFVKELAPKEYGGNAVGTVGRLIIIEEVSRVCPSTALTYLVGGMALYPALASEELIQKYYVPWVEGKLLPCFALTEPGAGSDPASCTTTAILDGDEYVINGVKNFATNGVSADVINVYAITDPSVPTSKGMSMIAVPKGTPGMTAYDTDMFSLNGAEIATIEFKNCRVPKGNLVGEAGKGFKYAMGGIAGGRINAAASAVGIAQHALDEAVKYAKEREQFKAPIANNQGISWYLAEMKCKVEAARAIVYKAAAMIDAKDPEADFFASIAKFEATEDAMFVADRALQIHGGFGCTKDCTAQRILRDAHACRIYDGTSDILKLVIARSVLK